MKRCEQAERVLFPSRWEKIALVFITCLSVSSNASGEDPFVVRSVSVSGNHYFSTQTILAILSLQETVPLSYTHLQQAGEKVLEAYSDEGYLDATIDTIVVTHDLVSHVVDVLFVFSEGKQSIVQSLSWRGDTLFTQGDIETLTRLKEGSIFRPTILVNDIEEILQYCDRRGYPFAALSLEMLQRTEFDAVRGWDIVFTLQKHQQVQLSDIRTEGLKRTKESVVRRQARIQAHHIYTSDIPPLVQKRLERLRIFRSVSEPTLYLTRRENDTLYSGGLALRVEEGELVTFDGMLGYAPSSALQKGGQVTGLVSLRFRNLFGTARKLSVRWFRERAMTQEIELGYTEPWLASLPINLSLNLFQRRQDSTYIRNRLDVAVEYMVSEEVSLAVSFASTTAHGIEGYGRQVIPESRTTTFGAAITYDTRDNVYTPTKGIYYFTEYSTGRKAQSALATLPAVKSATQRIVFDASYYHRVAVRHVLAFDAHSRSIRSSSLNVSDFFVLGGATTLRGYREGHFIGSNIFWLNTEYRILVTPRSFFFLFGDVGYYSHPASETSGVSSDSGTPYGYGGGLRFESAVGLIGVSIAFGKDDTFSTAKLHVRLSNEF